MKRWIIVRVEQHGRRLFVANHETRELAEQHLAELDALVARYHLLCAYEVHTWQGSPEDWHRHCDRVPEPRRSDEQV